MTWNLVPASAECACMSTSDKIRALAREGLETTEIAQRLGIRYQHAYGVLSRPEPAKVRPRTAVTGVQTVSKPARPVLAVETLVASGFQLSARWVLAANGDLRL